MKANIQGLLEKYKNREKERFFTDIFIEEEYSHILNKKADIVIDIGALAGEFSAYIYDKAQTIYALEPFPAYYKELTENVKEFDLSKIKPYQWAISDHLGTTRFSTSDNRGGNKIVDSTENTEVVNCISLAQFIKQNNIPHVDILKIDVEGHENRIFRAKDFYTVADKISLIIGEHLYDLGDVFSSFGFEKTDSYKQNEIYEKRL